MKKTKLMSSCNACLVCGRGRLQPRRQTDTIDVGDFRGTPVKVSNVPLEVCDYCGEIFRGPAAAKKRNRYLSRALGLLGPTEIRRVRRSIAQTREHFSKLTGIAEETITQWEEGKTLPSRAMDKYLRILSLRPAKAKADLGLLLNAQER